MTDARNIDPPSKSREAKAVTIKVQELLNSLRLRDAFALADREAARLPDSAKLHYQRGRLGELMISEEPDRALAYASIAREGFARAMVLRPQYPDAAAGMARILDREGNTAAAREVLEPFLRDGIVSPMLASAYGRIGPRVGEAEAACRVLLQVAGIEGDNASNETLHELARLLDRLGRYDEAFEYARRANDKAGVAYRRVGYQPGRLRRLVENTIKATPRRSMIDASRASNLSSLPVFIVGMGRSGTTLVEQIIDSHPETHGGGERRSVGRAYEKLEAMTGIAIPLGYARWPLAAIEAVAADFLAELAALAPEAKRITDKLPQNFLWLAVVHRMLPRARIIHCRRDPRDVLLSSYFQTNKVPVMETWDLYQAALVYRAQERLMAHWHEVLDLPILSVQYESLVQQPEIESRRIIAFLDLPWDDRCLAIEKNRRLVDTSNYASVRTAIHGDAVGRWRHYERHIEPMLRALRGEPETDAA